MDTNALLRIVICYSTGHMTFNGKLTRGFNRWLKKGGCWIIGIQLAHSCAEGPGELK